MKGFSLFINKNCSFPQKLAKIGKNCCKISNFCGVSQIRKSIVCLLWNAVELEPDWEERIVLLESALQITAFNCVHEYRQVQHFISTCVWSQRFVFIQILVTQHSKYMKRINQE
jgi:hypothetical protein